MENFFYRVSKNESIFTIADKFKLPQTLIIKENNLKRDVSEGDLIVLTEKFGEFYCVQPTDTIFLISKKFNLPEHKILSDNGIDYIFYGLKLLIQN